MEIRHIPSKVNPVDTIIRQIRTDDQVYSGEVKQLDKDLVDAIRIPVEASNANLQKKLDELYNKDGTRDKLKEASKQVLTMNEDDSYNAVLVVAESSIHIDNQFKQNIFNSLKEDDQYWDLIGKLEDIEKPNEISVHDRIFRIKQGTLKVHEKNQMNAVNY